LSLDRFACFIVCYYIYFMPIRAEASINLEILAAAAVAAAAAAAAAAAF
jgi:hypothetical protein